MSSLVIMIIFIISILLAIPVSISLGIASVLPGAFDPSFTASGQFVIRSMVGGIDSFPLIAVPMFVLSGIIMARGGISEKIFDVFSLLFGRFPAGIPCSVVATCMFFGAISGSGPATVAAVGSMTIPVLTALGYDRKFSTAIVAVAGGIGVIIPPSIPFIMYAMASGQSVSSLFIAGIMPGLLISLLIMIYCILYCIRNGEDRILIDKRIQELHDRGISSVIRDSLSALMAPVIVLGCIYAGITSPTEAAVISVFYSVAVSMLIYRSLRVSDMKEIISEAIRTFTPILFILAASMAFSRVLTLMQIPQQLSELILSNFSSRFAILIIINLLLLAVGMLMDTTPAILILAPVLLPIISEVGIDPVHFGVIMVVNLAIGFVTPPIGVNLFVASTISGIPVAQIASRVIPLIGFFLAALVLISIFPQISLMLL